MDTLTTLKIVLLILTLAFLAGCFVYLAKHPKTEVASLVFPCVLFFGLVYSLVFIPFTAPDEYTHYRAAYRLSSHLLFQQATDEDGNVLIREGDTELFSTELSEESYAEVYGAFFTLDHSEEKETYGISNAVMEVASHAYFPQAVGIALGRILHLGQVLCIYLGRWMNLIFFTACVWLAVRLAPFGKMVYFAAAMLPMTLELVSSLSYDAFVLGLVLLFTAYVLRLAYVPEAQVGWRQVLLLGLLLGLIAPCKMVYIPIAALCFLIPREKFGSGRNYAGAVFFVILCMAAGVLLVESDKFAAYFRQTENPVVWGEESAGYTISRVLHHPVQAMTLIIHTILQQLPTYVNTMFGGRLGWLEYEVSEALIMLLIFWTLLTAVPVEGRAEMSCPPVIWKKWKRKKEIKTQPEKGQEEMEGSSNSAEGLGVNGQDVTDASVSDAGMPVQIMRTSHRLVSVVLCLLVVLAVLVVMLLFWTPLDSDIVQGVQGRYFLPILPLALLAFRGKSLCWTRNMDRILIGGYCVINFLVLLSVTAGL